MVLGKKWSPEQIAKSIQISEKNFISADEFAKLKSLPTFVDANTDDYKKSGVLPLITVQEDEVKEEVNQVVETETA
jgi:hypothetical protein